MNIQKILNIAPDISMPLVLCPMAGVTDRAMRELCVEYGADYTVTEMVSAKAVCYGDKKSSEIADIGNSTRPCAIQIFGSEPEFMSKGAVILYEKYKPDVIDINMGCPVHKICANGEGSALMKDLQKSSVIIESVKKSVPCPVSVKFRSGWDESSINAPEFAHMAQVSGADFLCIHARTKMQMYNPPVNLDIITKVKESVDIPVIANGSVYSYADAEQMIRKTGCDAIGIARGAWGAPWIFAEIKAQMSGKPFNAPSDREKIEVAVKHLKKLIEYKGEYVGVHEARKHLSKYLYGISGACQARNKINTCEEADVMIEILKETVK